MKSKIIAIVFTAAFVMTPFLAVAASPGFQPLGLLASIENAFQGYLGNLYAAISTNVVNTTPTPVAPVPKIYLNNSITIGGGQKNVMVVLLQQSLISAGYLKGSVTGVFDGNTVLALAAYQKAKNLPVTGYIKIATSTVSSSFNAAASPFVSIQMGETSAQVLAVQKFLIGAGDLSLATPTTYFGVATQAAVIAFQKSHSLPQTGVINQATFWAMNGK